MRLVAQDIGVWPPTASVMIAQGSQVLCVVRAAQARANLGTSTLVEFMAEQE